MKRFSLISLLTASVCGLSAQPGPPQKEKILILGAHAHLGNGVAIEQSAIGFENGVITFVGTANKVRQEDYQQVIEAWDKHLYPGFIAVNTTLGISEIDAVRATHDYRETGDLNPNVRAIIAYNAESMVTPTTVSNGILLAQITPQGGRISGTSSVVQLDAWNWEDAVVREDDGIHLNWPTMTGKTGWYGSMGTLKPSEAAEKEITRLDEFFNDSRAWCEAPPNAVNLRLSAMCGVFSGEKNLYIHANRVKDIAAAIHFAKRHNVKKTVIVGGADAWIIPEMFRENEIGLILGRVHAMPDLPGDHIELPYRLPAILRDAGVRYGMGNFGENERMMLRNIPFNAGTAVANGVLYEQAVQAISLDVAELLGIDDRYGSVESGKSATLFVSEGDALDMRGNKVIYAFIDGRSVSLKNRQTELFERYKLKYAK